MNPDTDLGGGEARPEDIDTEKQGINNPESTASKPVVVCENFVGENRARSLSTGQLSQVGFLKTSGFEQHGGNPSGLSSSIPSQIEDFVDWRNVPFMNNFVQASLPVRASSLYLDTVHPSLVGVLPNQQAAQPLQSYTTSMVLNGLARIDWLSSFPTGGTGVGRLKRSLSETQRQSESFFGSRPPLQPRKRSVHQRAYDSEPPRASSTFTGSVGPVKRTSPRKRSVRQRAYDSEPPQASSTFTESVDTAKRTSLYRGVSYHRRDRKWTARTWLNGKMVHIGMYKSEKMAALMVDLKNLEVLGSDCHKKLNFTPLERRSLAKELAQEPKCPFAIKYYARD